MKRISGNFALRFGYARWLRHLLSGEPPGWAELGRATGNSGQAVSGWAERDEAPTNYKVHRPLAEALGVDRDWLIDGAGNAPDGTLWARWLQARAELADPFANAAEFGPAVDGPFDDPDIQSSSATGTSDRSGQKKRR